VLTAWVVVAARVILGAGVGLEGGTVPVYVAEMVESRLRGNLVSLYQFNIALGEVLGYAVAAMFITVPGNWRYILGSSLVFSTIMGVGILFMPESPRYLMHKGKPLEAFKVWKRIRGTATHEAREEFFVMKVSTEMEEAEVAAGRTNRFPWMDFFTKPRARRAIIYANIMIFLGQFTGINAIVSYSSHTSTLLYRQPLKIRRCTTCPCLCHKSALTSTMLLTCHSLEAAPSSSVPSLPSSSWRPAVDDSGLLPCCLASSSDWFSLVYHTILPDSKVPSGFTSPVLFSTSYFSVPTPRSPGLSPLKSTPPTSDLTV
jgi:MFS family permease